MKIGQNHSFITFLPNFDDFLAKTCVKYYPIIILRPDLESSPQNTSDGAIFECLAKILFFGLIMGGQWETKRAGPSEDLRNLHF